MLQYKIIFDVYIISLLILYSFYGEALMAIISPFDFYQLKPGGISANLHLQTHAIKIGPLFSEIAA